MRDLNYDFKQICRHNRDGSYATQADRQNILDLVADQLHEMGFRGLRAQGFKPKHVEKLVERWLAEHLAPGTIKNRMSHLRWLAQKIGKENIVARTQCCLRHSRIACTSRTSRKPRTSTCNQLEQIRCPYTQMSLRLQDAFGLRREASIKIVPARADKGDTLVLKASWNKGGREIRIPIRTAEQRQLLDEAKALAKGKSLVAPGYATYYAPSQALPLRVRASRHSWRPWPSPSLCAAALPRAHRLGMPRAWRADVEATHQAAEGARSRGSAADQPRDGPWSRAGDFGLFRSIGYCIRFKP